MDKIKNEIETLLHDNAPDFEISKLLKADSKAYFSTLDSKFKESSGKGFLLRHTRKIDTLLTLVYKTAMRSMFDTYMPLTNTLPITLLALGSYGREQLCVHSDIDLMIVYKEIPGYNTQEMIEKILYILWDAGLKLGHRVHEVSTLLEAAQSDITIKSSMLESRYIVGSKQLWGEVENELYRIRKDDPQGFIKAKIDELHQLHKKFPLTMEPNIKEGVGGFRNANLVFWVGKVLFNIDKIKDIDSSIVSPQEYKEFWNALEFLFQVRSALHLAAGTKEDQLRLQLIPEVSRYLGYRDTKSAQMQFSKKVIASLKTIRLYTTIWLEELSHYYDRETMLLPQSTSYLELLGQMAKSDASLFPVHPEFLKALHESPRPTEVSRKVYPLLMKIFEHPQSHLILTTLNQTLLLGYTIPQLKKCINLPQFDGYHKYAVDVHTIKCLESLENIKDKNVLECYEALSEREKVFMKLIVLLHDAGKGRKKPHSDVGMVLLNALGHKLKLSEEEIRIGKNLILHHLLMSTTAQREDLHSEQVILKFSSYFPTQKELDFIYILTYADMSGVGPNVYSAFAAELIAKLYEQSSLVVKNIKLLEETAKRVKKEKQLQKLPEFKAFSRILQKKVLKISSDMFFIKNQPEKIIEIISRVKTLDSYHYQISNNNFLTIEICRRDNLDLSYFLYKLSYLNVINMDIYKLFDGIKYFRIDFSEKIHDDDFLQLEELILESLHNVHELKINKPHILKEDIYINCNHSKENAIMKLNCVDQKGLLSYVINLFDKLSIDINSAKNHTKRNRINDLFLIEKNGNFCNNTTLIIKELSESR
jgi:[protein-PII] uridylyltransferase